MKDDHGHHAPLSPFPSGIKKLTVLWLFLLPFFSFLSPAAVINVPADYSTIQEAIDVATNGDEIIVSPDTYLENLILYGDNIILRSVDPTSPTIVASTIIDGDGAGSVVTFLGTELTSCVLSGFTLTNGYASHGAGIEGNGTEATIRYNRITSNTATNSGGGLYDCDGTIQNNIISVNSAYFNGGGLGNCDGTIQNNYIWGNSCDYYGGGLSLCNGIVQNNIIHGNSGYLGGGLAWCDGTVRNNTIYGNWAQDSGGGLGLCYGTIINCIAWNNTAPSGAQLSNCVTPSYSCIQNWWSGGTGNISLNPQLVDPANGDFHLQLISPCIDAGGYVADLMQDFEGDPRGCNASSEPRGDGSDFDIGADEYYKTTWTFEPPPDGWSYRTAVPPSGIPGWSHATSVQVSGPPGAIGLNTATSETTDYYGSWDNYSGNPAAPAVSWIDNSVWRSTFTMSSNKSVANTVPSIRLRFTENHMKVTAYIQLYPGSWVPLAERGLGTTDYMLYLRPPVTDNGFFLAFDMVDFGQPYGVPCNGTVYLEEVAVDRFDLTEPGFDDYWTTVITYSGTGLHSWTHSSAGVPYLTDVDSYGTTTDSLQQATTLAQTRAFGAWTSPLNEVDLIPDQFYRVVWNLACEDSTQVASMRMRMHTDDFRFASYMAIDRDPDPAYSPLPPTSGRDYFVYAEFPGIPTATKLLLAWDIYDFDPATGGWARLSDVMVSRRDLP